MIDHKGLEIEEVPWRGWQSIEWVDVFLWSWSWSFFSSLLLLCSWLLLLFGLCSFLKLWFETLCTNSYTTKDSSELFCFGNALKPGVSIARWLAEAFI